MIQARTQNDRDRDRLKSKWWICCGIPLFLLSIVAGFQWRRTDDRVVAALESPVSVMEGATGETFHAAARNTVTPSLGASPGTPKIDVPESRPAEVAGEPSSSVPSPLTPSSVTRDATLTSFFQLRALHQEKITFATEYKKGRCGAIVRNLCFKESQPIYYIRGKVPPTKGWATRVCNEATNKYRLNMILKEPFELDPNGASLPYPFTTLAAMEEGNGLGNRPQVATVIAPFCWELYGYHLLLCLLATYTHIESIQSAMPSNVAAQVFANPVILMMRGTGTTPFYVGSESNWSNPNPSPQRTLQSKAKPSLYWKLWKVLTPHPRNVFALPDLPPSCFHYAIWGSPPSTDMRPRDAQRFRDVIWDKLDLRRFVTDKVCGKYRVTLVERTTRYKIQNLDEVVQQIHEVLSPSDGAGSVHVASSEARDRWETNSLVLRLVRWENMNLDQQLEVAVQTDLLIGVHGNGLSWSLLMPSQSAVIELWPNVPYNANYLHFALKANVAHFNTKGDGKCPQRCPAKYDLRGSLREAKQHMDNVACRRQFINTTILFEKMEQDRKLRKTKGKAKDE